MDSTKSELWTCVSQQHQTHCYTTTLGTVFLVIVVVALLLIVILLIAIWASQPREPDQPRKRDRRRPYKTYRF